MNASQKLFAVLALGLASTGRLSGAPTVNYEKQLFPLLKDNCLACHNKTTTKGGLNMETPELMLKGGDSGPALEPGKGEKSLVFLAAGGEWDSEMPPKNNKVGAVALSASQLVVLRQWIDEGALHSGKQQQTIAWQPLPAGFRPIYAASMSPDGAWSAAARGNQISLYHLPTGRLATRLTDDTLLKSGLYSQPGVAHRDVVTAILFSPDGTRLATGGFREVKLWKRDDLAPRGVPAPAPVAEGKFRLAIAPGGAVSLIDQPTGKVLREVKHGAEVTLAVLDPTAQRFVTTGADRRIKLWETATGKMLVEILTDRVTTEAFLRQADVSAAAAVEVGWQAEVIKKAEKEVADLGVRLKKTQDLEPPARKTLEEKRGDKVAKEKAKTAADEALKALQMQLSALPADKPDAALAKKAAEAQELAAKATAALALAHEAQVRAEAALEDAGKEIQLVKKATIKASQARDAAKAALETARKALDSANLGKVAAAQALGRPGMLPAQVGLVFSPSGDRLAGVDAEGTVRTWSAVNAQPVNQQGIKVPGRISAIAWSTEAGVVVMGEQGSVLLPEPSMAAWKLERVLGTGDGASEITDRAASLAFSPDGKTLAVGSGEPSRSGDITLWEVFTGKLQKRFDERHFDSVFSLDFSPDGKHLASGGADKVIRITDLTTGQVSRVFEGHTHHILGLSWRRDGRLLASAGADNVVKIWDWIAGERRTKIAGWDKEVTSLRYVGQGDTLITASGDGKVRLLTSDGTQVKLMATVPGFMNAVSPTLWGDAVVAGGQDGTLRVWEVSSGKLVREFGK